MARQQERSSTSEKDTLLSLSHLPPHQRDAGYIPFIQKSVSVNAHTITGLLHGLATALFSVEAAQPQNPRKCVSVYSPTKSSARISPPPPICLGWKWFVETWKLDDLIITSLQKIRDRAQELLLRCHKEHFLDGVPILYHLKDCRKQALR